MVYYERNLPHWHPDGKAIFLTWRLFGSLPRELLITLANLREDAGKQFLVADDSLGHHAQSRACALGAARAVAADHDGNQARFGQGWERCAWAHRETFLAG
jgi:hypothetical protein